MVYILHISELFPLTCQQLTCFCISRRIIKFGLRFAHFRALPSGAGPEKILTAARIAPRDRIINIFILEPELEERKILRLKIGLLLEQQ